MPGARRDGHSGIAELPNQRSTAITPTDSVRSVASEPQAGGLVGRSEITVFSAGASATIYRATDTPCASGKVDSVDSSATVTRMSRKPVSLISLGGTMSGRASVKVWSMRYRAGTHPAQGQG